jgi:hypothetical protein
VMPSSSTIVIRMRVLQSRIRVTCSAHHGGTVEAAREGRSSSA